MGMLNMRLVAGEVDVAELSRFNSTRKDIMENNTRTKKYLKTKSLAVRTFIHVFNKYPLVFIELATKADMEELNEIAKKNDETTDA